MHTDCRSALAGSCIISFAVCWFPGLRTGRWEDALRGDGHSPSAAWHGYTYFASGKQAASCQRENYVIQEKKSVGTCQLSTVSEVRACTSLSGSFIL